MSLELDKNIMKPKSPRSPANMAIKYWKSQAKESRKKISLKHYFLQKQLLEMLNIKSDAFGNPIPDLTIDVREELKQEKLDSEFKSLLFGSSEQLVSRLNKSFESSEKAIEKYTGNSVSDMSSVEKINAMFEAHKKAEVIALTSEDSEVKAGAAQEAKDLIFAMSAQFIQSNPSVKSEFSKASKKHHGNSEKFEKTMLVGGNSDYVKNRLNDVKSRIDHKLFNLDLEEDSYKNKSKVKLKM